MKALTVYQPWASLIMVGAKPHEFRGWAFPDSLVGARAVIHASARPVKPAEVKDLLHRFGQADRRWTTGLIGDRVLEVLNAAHRLPLASGLGTVTLGRPVLAASIAAEFGADTVADSDRIDHQTWAWPMLDPQPFPVVGPARGLQGFWDWPEGAA